MRPYVGLSSGVSLCIVLLVVLLLCCWTGWLDIMLSDGMLVEGSSTSPMPTHQGQPPGPGPPNPNPGPGEKKITVTATRTCGLAKALAASQASLVDWMTTMKLEQVRLRELIDREVASMGVVTRRGSRFLAAACVSTTTPTGVPTGVPTGITTSIATSIATSIPTGIAPSIATSTSVHGTQPRP